MSVAVASLLITHNRLRSGSAEFKLCVAAGGVAKDRWKTVGRVVAAGGVLKSETNPVAVVKLPAVSK